jgi:hypothetical protein
MNAKLTTYATLSGAIGSCSISSNGPVTTSYAPAGSRRNTLKTPETWLTCSSGSVRISYRCRGIEFGGGGSEDMEAIWIFYCTLFLHFLLFPFDCILALQKWRRDEFLPPTNGGGGCPFAHSAERSTLSLPIGCVTDGFILLCTSDDCFILCFSFLVFSYTLALAVQEVCV